MEKPNFVLSEGDGALMSDARRVEHPSVFGPLLERLPEDTRGMKVVAAYEIAKDDPRGKGDCAACHHHGNHSNGLILELPDGSHASLGRVCGEKRHGFKHKELIEAFDEDTTRGETLRRVMAALDHLLPAAAHVLSVPGHPQIAGLEQVRQEFERRFGKLYSALAGSNGRLFLMMWVPDDERMIARKKWRDGKAEGYAERIKEKTGRDVTRAEVEAHFAGDDDFSTEPLERQEDRQVATFSGTFFFAKLGRLQAIATHLANQMHRAFLPLDNMTSDRMATGVLQARVREFAKAVNDAIKLIDDLNESAALFSPTNFGEIVRWANKRSEVGIGGVYRVERGALLCDFKSGPPHRLAFPEILPAIPRGPLTAALAALEGTKLEKEVERLDVNVA